MNKFLSFFCLILIWCVCMIFSKISPVTSHGAFSTRFDLTAGNTPCRKINQSMTSIHSVPSLGFPNSASRKHPVEVFGNVQEMSHSGKNAKNKLQTQTQESLYDSYLKNGIGWHTMQYGKGYCQRYDDFQGNDSHFIGDSLNIVYFSNTPLKFSGFSNEPFVHARFIHLQFSVLFYFKHPSDSLSAPYAPWQWHITLYTVRERGVHSPFWRVRSSRGEDQGKTG